jgi:hypothetical protein
LDDQPPLAGVLYPLINTAAVAIELYLKCLSAEKVYADVGVGWARASAGPERGHDLTALLGEVEGDLRDELHRAFQIELAFVGLSFRSALEQCEGAFEASRYPFEQGHDPSNVPVELLMNVSRFLQRFVSKLHRGETIQGTKQEPQHARSQSH